ncbi:hypothetical protein BGZ61DRAFT_518561 [Ilyonectria robusta]|uniref:uncharacterized protein n=1 Tax=Ilyonectria robusta TaxID=1079257 RepID=UPI001E8E291B|nr:uncharacterized protein BGZ61DRAFT_518561 [Ilyonectria robusta]KAH8688516.1 hypothetical protein BGZ61DRAFT_518561 [Ilyonectria robusta]
MHFSAPKAIAAAFFFFSLAAADLHENCACNNGDAYNWRMTTAACTTYDDAQYQWGGVTYDSPSGRCVKENDTDRLAGDQWETACKDAAKNGFACSDGLGTCFANPDDVSGAC